MPSWSRSLQNFVAVAVLIILGCHTAPPRGVSNVPAIPRRTRWIDAYLTARRGAPDACRTFTELARDAEFPLPRLAELRADEACDQPPFQIERAELPAYLRELGLDVSLKIARATKDRAAEADLAADVARRKLPQRERIEWLNLALRRARETNQTAKVNAIRAQLYQAAPRLNPAPRPDQLLAVAIDFRQARDFARSRRTFERIIAGDFSVEDKINALKGLRLARKNARQSTDHLRAAHRLSQFLVRKRALLASNARVRAAAFEALTYEGRAVWTAGQPTEARKIFAAVELQLRGKYPLADLYLLRARLAEETKAFPDVRRYLDLALAERPTDAVRDKILWYAAWNERARGQADEAIARLRELESTTHDDPTRARALYWLGTTFRERDRAKEADDTFARLITLDPLGYYGLLAHRQLGRVIRLRRGTLATTNVATLDANLVDWLVAFDERDALQTVLDEAAAAYAKRDDQNDDGWSYLLQNYARAGLYLKLFEGLGNLAPERRRAVLDGHPELLFPRPWPELTSAAAARAGIDEALILAIMRQESAFDPLARSGADAFGLMQLLPEVAERTARRIGVPYRRPEDLFEPATVIPLGAAFLRELSDRYRGQLILLSAAYNASDAAITVWVRDRFRGDVLQFIEEIPYEETRTYVRLVMRNLIFYQLLKAEGAGVRFPESVLKMDAGSAG